MRCADCPADVYVLPALAGLQDVDDELRRECTHFMTAYAGLHYLTVNKLSMMNVASHKPAQPDATIDDAHKSMFEGAVNALKEACAGGRFSADLKLVDKAGWKTVGDVRTALLKGTYGVRWLGLGCCVWGASRGQLQPEPERRFACCVRCVDERVVPYV